MGNKTIEFSFEGKIESYRRMTRYSKHSEEHQAYYAFKDLLLLRAKEAGYRPDEHIIDTLYVTVWFACPKSWSKKKKLRAIKGKHRQKPDLDNIVKGIADALTKKDQTIIEIDALKAWSFDDSEGGLIRLGIIEKSTSSEKI